MILPTMYRVRQHLERPILSDIPGTVQSELERLDLAQRIKPGQRVALTAGSRGIANIPVILKAVADHLKSLGARPFLIPTMGSHGGGIAAKQRSILESYGITEEFVGVPILASMETVEIGTTPEGWPVHLDRHAHEADHIAVIARIKPHTAFHGPIESGLLKMMLIGLGKHAGALWYHRLLIEQEYDRVVRSVARTLLACAPIAFGLAIVENGYDETAFIEAIEPDDFERREEALLIQARRLLPKLPVRTGDLLIVDQIGKEISGSGMDTNVVGRKRAFRGQPAPPEMPNYRLIFVRALSPKTQGNASGIGLADFTTNRLIQSMNYADTVTNCLTAGYPEGAFLPVTMNSDREVIEAALKIIGLRQPHEARVVRILDTLHVDEVEVSQAVLDDPSPQTRFEVIAPLGPYCFDDQGNLAPL
ncbi:MAG: lactate racemase domain-containing protein [Gemmataceae bacterium]